MPNTIADYGLIGDMQTAALVGKNGSIDWLCWPDFDSEACFCRLIGTPANGFWQIAPSSRYTVSRRYIPGTLVLETVFRLPLGAQVSVTDFMPACKQHSALIRIVRGLKGAVKMAMCLAPRFDYGSAQPLVIRRDDSCWEAITGPHKLTFDTSTPLVDKLGDLSAAWTVRAGDVHRFVLQHSSSYGDKKVARRDAEAELEETIGSWQAWNARNRYDGPYKEAVQRSVMTLRALTYAPSGGFVAAPTTSLPEKVGGIRNWDYRFCWLRDTELSLTGLQQCGYTDEAKKWLDWLGRSVQGDPAKMQILYGVTGKREHSEWTAGWLTGYQGSKPVHIGNKASSQLQLDVYGEVMDALYHARRRGLYPLEDESGAVLELPLLEHLEKVWQSPDAGLWEFRGNKQQFTHSKVMTWMAFDRGVRMAKEFGLKAPVKRWTELRDTIHAEVCRMGYHRGMNSFTQAYGSRDMDAALLRLPLVGFLPANDPRIVGTVRALEDKLMRNGLLWRYNTKQVKDGLPPGEGAFLACNFWLVDVYVLMGRRADAKALFEKLLGLCNDVGLLSEEFDPKHGLVGNMPQAFSHISLVHSALSLATGRPAQLEHLF